MCLYHYRYCYFARGPRGLTASAVASPLIFARGQPTAPRGFASGPSALARGPACLSDPRHTASVPAASRRASRLGAVGPRLCSPPALRWLFCVSFFLLHINFRISSLITTK